MVRLIQQYGFRVLSPVEHDDRTLNEDFPSWVPFRWNVEYTMCTFDIHSDFHYDASAGTGQRSPAVVENSYLKVRGLTVDVVSKAYQFSASDLETPVKLKPSQPVVPHGEALDHIWRNVQDAGTTSAYPWEERLSAFSLTLCAGLSTYDFAEENLVQHRDNFAAYWRLRAQSPTLEGELLADLQEAAQRGDQEKFRLDMRLACEGRSFLFTRKGYYALGPWLAKPGGICCVFFGATVPFILREVDEAPITSSSAKLTSTASCAVKQ